MNPTVPELVERRAELIDEIRTLCIEFEAETGFFVSGIDTYLPVAAHGSSLIIRVALSDGKTTITEA